MATWLRSSLLLLESATTLPTVRCGRPPPLRSMGPSKRPRVCVDSAASFWLNIMQWVHYWVGACLMQWFPPDFWGWTPADTPPPTPEGAAGSWAQADTPPPTPEVTGWAPVETPPPTPPRPDRSGPEGPGE